MTNIAEALLEQQSRCREILEIAVSIGPAGAYLAATLRNSLSMAERAAVEGDIQGMMKALKDLKGYEF